MTKPVIIFGAGASYSLSDTRKDHINQKELSPPLTNNLFDERFYNYYSKYPLMQELIGPIEAWIKKGNSLESYLTKLAKKNTDIARKQSIEIQFYLYDLFKNISESFIKEINFQSNNYVNFLRELDILYKEACLVTFNYDLFLDKSMEIVFGYEYFDINSYFKNRKIELYKVHGSVNWGYVWNYSQDINLNEKVDYLLRIAKPNKALNKPSVITDDPYFKNHLVTPALHIPEPTDKQFIIREFESPLIENIKNANKVIIIGWSAGDEYFSKIIKENIDIEKAQLITIAPKFSEVSESEKILNKLELGDPKIKWKKKPLSLDIGFKDFAENDTLLAEVLQV